MITFSFAAFKALQKRNEANSENPFLASSEVESMRSAVQSSWSKNSSSQGAAKSFFDDDEEIEDDADPYEPESWDDDVRKSWGDFVKKSKVRRLCGIIMDWYITFVFMNKIFEFTAAGKSREVLGVW